MSGREYVTSISLTILTLWNHRNTDATQEGGIMARGRDGLHVRELGILAFSYKDERGVWREKYTGSRDRTEAREFRDNFLVDVWNSSLPNDMANWRMDAAEKRWIQFRTPRVATGTINSEKYRLQSLRNFLENKRLREIDNNDLDRYVEKRLGDLVSEATINKEIQLWSYVLQKAKLWRRLQDDYRPLPTIVNEVGTALTRAELRNLAKIAQGNRSWTAAFYAGVLGANTGMRGGEIKMLRLGVIDLERGRLVVRRRTTKTHAGARHIELNVDAAEAVTRLLLRANALGSVDPDHFLLPKNLSRIQHTNNVKESKRGYDPTQHQTDWGTAWNSLRRKAGLPKLRFHDLRHTFITHMIERGISISLVQTMVGHLSPRMVRHYTHIASGAAREAVSLLDSEPMLVENEATWGSGREKCETRTFDKAVLL